MAGQHTYDDGPNDIATDALLDLSAKHNAGATFFMIGSFVRQRPEIVRRVHAAGHLLGNHTQTHPWVSFQSSTVIREELRDCNTATRHSKTPSERPSTICARPTARRPMVFRVAEELGLD